jgi:hypothetical protein
MSAGDPNGAWDRSWRVARPADIVDGLYRLHQLDALYLLRCGCPLTEWEAEFLQIVLYRAEKPSNIQHYWLRRIERDALGAVAA